MSTRTSRNGVRILFDARRQAPAAAGSIKNVAPLPARAARATGSSDSRRSSASRTTAAFDAPKAATTTSAPLSAGSVSVRRHGGGYGEFVTATTRRLVSSSAGCPGKSEQT
jgi:hypothetical protein